MQQGTCAGQPAHRPSDKLEGGFRIISTHQICLVWTAYRSGRLTKFLDVRIYWALHEVFSRREAARHARGRERRIKDLHKLPPSLLVREVQCLVGYAQPAPIRASLRRLQLAGIIALESANIQFAQNSTWGDGGLVEEVSIMLGRIHARPCVRERNIACPRRILRLLATSASPCLHATVMAHLIRCLWRSGDKISGSGLCVSRFVSEVFQVDQRNVKRARSLLRRIGWLTRIDGLHRGSGSRSVWVSINLRWREVDQKPDATLPPEIGACDSNSPPPNKKRELPSGSKNQYGAPARKAGVRKRTGLVSRPGLANVLPDDLREPARLRRLFQQAVRFALLRDCVADQLRFAAAAAHALRVGKQNPCGLFVSFVRRGLWNYLSQADEEAGRLLLKHAAWESGGTLTVKSSPKPASNPSHHMTPLATPAAFSVNRLINELSHRLSVDRAIRTVETVSGAQLSSSWRGAGPGRPSLTPTGDERSEPGDARPRATQARLAYERARKPERRRRRVSLRSGNDNAIHDGGRGEDADCQGHSLMMLR